MSGADRERSRSHGLTGNAPLRRGALPIALGVLLVAAALRTAPALGARLGAVGSGLLTLLAMLLAAAYGARRRVPRFSLRVIRALSLVPVVRRFQSLIVRLDQMRTWRVTHLVIGTLCVLPLWWHVDAARGGLLEQVLLAVVLLILLSGVIGAVLQYAMPQAMLRSIEREVRVRDVQSRQRAVFVAAEETILGREALADVYVRGIRRIVQGAAPRRLLVEALVRGQDPGALVLGPIRPLGDALDEGDAERFRNLLELAAQKVRLDLNLLELSITTGWLAVHDVAVLCGAALVALHVLSVLYYGGV